MARAAFFDMDRTVLRVNTGVLWVKHLRRKGEISRWQLLRAYGWAIQYKLALLDIDEVSRRIAGTIVDAAEDAFAARCEEWYVAEVLPEIAEPARTAIEAHRRRGDRVVLLTGATRYVAEPLARTLGLDAALCTHLEVVGGRFTGRIVDPMCYGPGKVVLAERWAKSEGIGLESCAFYSDSYNDLPMLERVGEPVAVNPDPRLLRVARQRGWRIHRWDGAT